MLEIDVLAFCKEKLRLSITQCHYDSRCIEKGGLFFALKGQKTDGHLFLRQAREKGAIAAVVEETYQGEDFGLFLFRSKNVIESLQMLAKKEMEKRKLKVLAITGSVGKTTTKEFVFQLLENHFSIYKSPGNYNTQISVPLNILNSPINADILLLEMAMSQPGEIKKLVDMAPPSLAVITKLALAHAENFAGGLQDIAKEKLQILSHKKTEKKIVHHELLHYQKLNEVKTFSTKEKQAYYFLKIEEKMLKMYENGKEKITLEKTFTEKHFLEDMAAAIAAVREMGVSYEEIASQVPKLKLPSLRGEKIKKKGILFINDSYNANETSTKAALISLNEYPNRKIAILGEMKDLGKFSPICHEKVAEVALKCVDEVICYGQESFVIFEIFQKQKKFAKFFVDKNQMIAFLKKHLQKHDVVLIKGSRSCNLETIVDLI